MSQGEADVAAAAGVTVMVSAMATGEPISLADLEGPSTA